MVTSLLIHGKEQLLVNAEEDECWFLSASLLQVAPIETRDKPLEPNQQESNHFSQVLWTGEDTSGRDSGPSGRWLGQFSRLGH